MPKSQKKPATLSSKLQSTHKTDKVPPKAVKKVATPVKSAIISKRSMILALLQRSVGATIDDMAKATGWQRHSVHGMMSGVLRKKLGLSIASDTEERGRVYRITGSVSRL